jgi:Mg-chelatase subunit ChlI
MTAKKIDATRPLYAVVGVTDLAVEIARNYTADVQARFADVQTRVSKIELEPKALRDQARTLVVSGIDELNEDVKGACTTVESRAKEARTQVEAYVNEAVAEVTETYGDLAVRGRKLVERIRRQQATQDAQAATKTTVAKAKTAKTQTTKSAKSSASATKSAAKTTTKRATASAKKTAGTAKSNAKATTTSAKKAAEATAQAATDAAEKVGD